MYVNPLNGSRANRTHCGSRSLSYGRFLEPDPLGYEAGPNLYAYVDNDPINFTDPLGLDAEPPPIVVTGSRCPSGWSCYDVGHGFQTVSSGDLIVVTARRRSGTGGRRGGWLTRLTNSVQTATHNLVCSFESFSVGGDLALGVGPVARGSAGVQWNQRTGQVSWYRSVGVGYGAALIGGLSGTYSTQGQSTGRSETWNGQVALGGGLTAGQSGSQSSVGVGLGPRVGAEISKTQNSTRAGNWYVANKGCP